MKFTYRPDAGDVQVWSFKPGEIKNSEAEMIERRTDWTWDEFVMKLQQGSTLARRALLWTFLRRTHHVLRFEDVEFTQSQVELEFDLDELYDMRSNIEKAPEKPGLDKEMLLSVLDAQIAERAQVVGKELEETSSKSGSSHSFSLDSPPPMLEI